MGFKEAISSGLKNYVNFQGRASRSEYWWFMLFWTICYVITIVIDGIIGIQVVSSLFALGLGLPTIGLAIRRLHDLDRSGWWYLICLVPVVGGLVLLYFFVTKGTEGDNRFGADPLGGVDAEVFT